MDRLGILIEDYSGVYIVKQWLELKPELDYYIIRDRKSSSETETEYIQKNLRRFHRLGVEEVLVLRDTDEKVLTWSQLSRDARAKADGEIYTWSQVPKAGTSVPEMLLHTMADGVLGRGFTGFILRDYMNEIPKSADTLFLDVPGLGRVLPWLETLAEERELKVIEPLNEYIKTLPQGKGQGRSIFYWTERDFPFERRAQEILQQEIEFQIWRDLKWLRRTIEDMQ